MSNPKDRETILYAFATEASHDRSTLERYLKQYPELAEELIDLSSEIRYAEAMGPEPEEAADPGAKAALSAFLGCEPRPTPPPSGVNPLARYTGAAFASLAEKLKVPRSILAALRHGLVVPTSVPSSFMTRLAEATGDTIPTLRENLGIAQQASVGLAFKSDVKPSHQGQTTFRELVQNTAMPDEQRLLLQRECDEDELT